MPEFKKHLAIIRNHHYLMLFSLFIVTSCNGSFSTLAPAGPAAEIIANIFWWMLGGAIFIWIAFLLICLYAVVWRPEKRHNARQTSLFIIGGGVLFPIVVLSVLIYFSLLPLPVLLRPAPEGSLQVEVTGYQWWWRVRYIENGKVTELANEIHLPLNKPVQFILKSEDVIHSFWIPSLGGKMDMIPGHVTRIALTGTKPGIFGGVCAEYCGASHALMMFKAKVSEQKVFDEWLAHQKQPATEPQTELGRQGREAFKSYGCLACHTVRGVGETGVIAPDLTHVGSRLSLGAGILPNNKEAFLKWLIDTHNVKPQVKMPTFDMIPEEDLKAISAWLEELK